MCTNGGIITVLSLVPLRWFIPILVDSRLMHLDKSQPEVWVTPQHTRLCLSLDPSGPALAGRSTRLERLLSHFSWAEVRAGHPQEPWQLQGGSAWCHKCATKSCLNAQRAPLRVFLLEETPWSVVSLTSCWGWWCFWRLWPPPERCDPGAQGDKTNINLLDPPACSS